MVVPASPQLTQIAFVRDFVLLFIEKAKQQTQSFEELSNVSQQELLVLLILTRQGPLIVKDIARHMRNVSLSTLTRILDRLETHALLTRELDRADRRSFRIVLTAEGKQLVRRYHSVIAQMAEVILAPLTPAERLILIELFGKIAQTFTEDAESAALLSIVATPALVE